VVQIHSPRPFFSMKYLGAALQAEIQALRHKLLVLKDPVVVIASVWDLLVDCCGFGSHLSEAASRIAS
jgi:hypothetical protein